MASTSTSGQRRSILKPRKNKNKFVLVPNLYFSVIFIFSNLLIQKTAQNTFRTSFSISINFFKSNFFKWNFFSKTILYRPLWIQLKENWEKWTGWIKPGSIIYTSNNTDGVVWWWLSKKHSNYFHMASLWLRSEPYTYSTPFILYTII